MKAFQNTFLKNNSSTAECSTAWVRFKVTLPHDCADRWRMLENAESSRKKTHVCFMIMAKTTVCMEMDFLNDDLSPSRRLAWCSDTSLLAEWGTGTFGQHCLMSLLIPKFSDFPKEIIKVSSYLSHADAQMAAGRDLADKRSNPWCLSQWC